MGVDTFYSFLGGGRESNRRQLHTAGPYIGSKCEKLGAGKSGPLCLNQRASIRTAATSLMGQRPIGSPFVEKYPICNL